MQKEILQIENVFILCVVLIAFLYKNEVKKHKSMTQTKQNP